MSAGYQRIELENLGHEPLSRRFLDEDTEYDPANVPLKQHTTWKSRFTGWRGGVLAALSVSSLVLLFNIIMVIVASTAWEKQDNIATAFTGNCSKARGWTIALHLIINLLSSLLLGASNYCMQRLVSPTRKEVDIAHSKKRSLDIGMPSVKNLSAISKERVFLWALLFISSAPLHLVYNSVVFETIAANNVDYLIVTDDFFRDKNSWSIPPAEGLNTVERENLVRGLQKLVLDDKYLDRNLFEKLSGAECTSRYGQSFITNAGAGFAVPTRASQAAIGMSADNSFYLAQSGSGSINTTPGSLELDYCYSQIVPQRCEVQFSITILVIVIISNIIKVTLMAAVLWRLNIETLVTVGDAIKSFLNNPDPTTESCCLMSRRNVDQLWNNPESRFNQRWKPSRYEPFFVACTKRRWLFSLALYAVAIITAGALIGINQADKPSVRGRNGFGRVNTDYIIDVDLSFADSIIPYVLLANLPQAVISFIYITYNGLFTCMLAGREWSRYAIKRAPLRVTVPAPGQRSTYFLQLPYTWSIPLLIGSVLLHWFVSQAIFLARFAVYKNGVPVDTINDRLQQYQHLQHSGTTFSGIGYSDIALLASIGWGSAMIAICLLVAGIFTYPKGLPVGGTNSAVISAACHIRYEGDENDRVEDDTAEKPVMWGVTIRGNTDKIGHCSFSANDVESPIAGHLYAGSSGNRMD